MTPDQTTAAQDEAAAFTSTQRAVEFGGATIAVRPLDIGKIIQISGDLHDAVPALFGLADAGGSEADQIAAFLRVLGRHGTAVLRVLSIAADLPLATLQDSRDIAGLWRLAVAVFEENRDFFLPQVAGLLGDLQGRMAALQGRPHAGDGLTPSSSLSAPAST